MQEMRPPLKSGIVPLETAAPTGSLFILAWSRITKWRYIPAYLRSHNDWELQVPNDGAKVIQDQEICGARLTI